MVKKIGREFENQKEMQKEEVKILEMDELYTYIKRTTNKIRVWTAVNRNKVKFLDFVVGGGERAAE